MRLAAVEVLATESVVRLANRIRLLVDQASTVKKTNVRLASMDFRFSGALELALARRATLSRRTG